MNIDDMTKEEILQYLKDKFSLELIDKKEVVNYLEEERIKKKKKVAAHYAEARECMEHIGCDDTGIWEGCAEFEKKQAEICDKQSEILLYVKHWVEERNNEKAD